MEGIQVSPVRFGHHRAALGIGESTPRAVLAGRVRRTGGVSRPARSRSMPNGTGSSHRNRCSCPGRPTRCDLVTAASSASASPARTAGLRPGARRGRGGRPAERRAPGVVAGVSRPQGGVALLALLAVELPQVAPVAGGLDDPPAASRGGRPRRRRGRRPSRCPRNGRYGGPPASRRARRAPTRPRWP